MDVYNQSLSELETLKFVFVLFCKIDILKMTKHECRRTKEDRMPKAEATYRADSFDIRISSFGFRHSPHESDSAPSHR